MFESFLTVYLVVLGLVTGAFVIWAICKILKSKREQKLTYFDKDDQRFIN